MTPLPIELISVHATPPCWWPTSISPDAPGRYCPNRLLALLEGDGQTHGLRDRAKGLLLLTATPMQLDPVEVYDLLRQLKLPGPWAASEQRFLRFFEELRAGRTGQPADWASLFKSAGAGEGFRHFRLGGTPGLPRLQVRRVHDLVEVKPFGGAANRTATVTVKKGVPIRYPVPYVVWRRLPGGSLSEDMTLEEVRARTQLLEHEAFPITAKTGAPWITGPPGALEAVQKVIGASDYKAWAGACTWLNGVYWVRILERLGDGKLLIENLHDVGKIAVRCVQARIEPDLVFPLLRGRDVQPWLAQPEAQIFMVQDAKTRKGYAETEMRVKWPLTYAYLKGFEAELRNRSGFRKYFKPSDPFYSIYNVGPQTLAKFKVVWAEQAQELTAAAVLTNRNAGKSVVPDHKLMVVAVTSPQEAFYLAGALNSAPVRLVVGSYVVTVQTSTHVLKHIKIPRFDPKKALHERLAELSQQAHSAAVNNQTKQMAEIEGEMDRAAAELWGITQKELRTIQQALRNRKPRSRPKAGEESV